ncbi:hypothetical protein VIGAN_03009900, partial [Vigna angularis var. angularis]
MRNSIKSRRWNMNGQRRHEFRKEDINELNKERNSGYLLFAFTFTRACFGFDEDDEFSGMAHQLHRRFGLWLEESFLHV